MGHKESLALRDEFSVYARSRALLHEGGDGELVEYRRILTPDRPVIFIEHRVLRPNGTPFDDSWYIVCDSHRRYMIHNAAEILAELRQL